MRRTGWVFAATCAASCGWGSGGGPPAAHPGASKLGAITVLARDHDSGEVVAHADLALRGPQARALTTSKYGFATFDQLPPGTYDLVGTFAAQPSELDGIVVRANQTDYVDVTFTLGRADPIKQRFGDAHESAIDNYRPAGLDPALGRIEGAVIDVTTRARVVGAVVTAVDASRPLDALQAVSDDQGRYRFDDVAPGTYAVSAYYSMTGRGQIEVRRSAIDVAGGEAVVVPLSIEIAR